MVDCISASARLREMSVEILCDEATNIHLSVFDLTKGTLTSWPARLRAADAAAARASKGEVETGMG